jgi:glucokinase
MAVFPYPCLVADVGGTNARFAVVAERGGKLSPMIRLATGQDADFAEATRRAIREAGFPTPKSFLLAVAGPVADRGVTLTNAATQDGRLTIDGPRLVAALQLEQGLMLNDFEALCLALPVLPSGSLLRLSHGNPVAGEPMLVVGPGTGLGVGALLHKDGAWLPLASEGGHVDLGPRTEAEFALWPHLGSGPVSAEDLLSGRGLVRLYNAVCAQQGISSEEGDAAVVTSLALQGEAKAVSAVQHFFGLLARTAGNMALAFCARGGVFIGGGIAPRFAEMLNSAEFASAFSDKGAASAYLSDIPVTLITAPDAALQGLSAVADKPADFALNYATRCWR